MHHMPHSHTQIQERLSRLTLDNEGTVRVEKERIARYGDFPSPLYVKLPFDALCLVLDVVYNNRPIQVRHRATHVLFHLMCFCLWAITAARDW